MFGSSAATGAPLFGGSAATTAAPFSFSAATSTGAPRTNLFGNPATSAAPLFAPTSSAAGGGLLGTANLTSSFGFGQPRTTASGFGGGTSLFGPSAATTTSAAPLFGGGLGFGQPPRSTPASTGFFGFSNPTTSSNAPTFSLGGPSMTAAPSGSQNAIADNLARLIASTTGVQIYGDERDKIIEKLNQLQAMWGTGKGFYVAQGPPVDYTPDCMYSGFKAVGYNRMPEYQDSDGYVGLVVKRSSQEVQSHQQNLADSLRSYLGNKPNIKVEIDNVKPLKVDACEVVIYVTEDNQGLKRRIGAGELSAYLNQPNVKQILSTNLAVESVAAKTRMDAEKLKQWLLNPPQGVVDPVIWAQAQADNPSPSELIPWPILGFQQLKERQNMQVEEGKVQKDLIERLSEKISDLEEKGSLLESRISQSRSKQQQLEHRLLKLVAVQCVSQRHGYALDENEEKLQARMEALNTQLNAPMHVKSRLNEILSAVRTQPDLLQGKTDWSRDSNSEGNSDEQFDSEFLEDVQLHLKKCQEALEGLVSVVQKDNSDMNIIAQNLLETDQSHRNVSSVFRRL